MAHFVDALGIGNDDDESINEDHIVRIKSVGDGMNVVYMVDGSKYHITDTVKNNLGV